MNMASIDIDVLKNMIAEGVQIIAYRMDPGAVWTAIPATINHVTDSRDYWPILDDFAASPVSYDTEDECFKMHYLNRKFYMLKFSNGWEWSHERGLYDSHWKEPIPPVKIVEKYYRIRICGDDVQFTDMTEEIKELVQTSKELGLIVATAVAAVQKVEKEKDNG